MITARLVNSYDRKWLKGKYQQLGFRSDLLYMEIFYAATSIVLGNGRKTPFWHAPWLDGRMPKDIAPKIYDLCKRKKWTVAQALHGNEWINKLSSEATNLLSTLHNLCTFGPSFKMCN
jgi:hypothetical protein